MQETSTPTPPMTPTHFDETAKNDEKSKKKITILSVFLVIFILATLGLAGYVIYSLMNPKVEVVHDIQPAPEMVEEEDTMLELNEGGEPPELEGRTKVLNFYPNSVAILEDGLVYVSINGSTRDIDNVFGEGTYQTLVATQKNYQEFEFDNLVYTDGNAPFKGMKMDISGVVDVYTYESGQQINPEYGLIFQYEDGDLSYISLKKLIEGTDIPFAVYLEGVENVVSENNGGMTTYAVLEDGEKVDLTDLIPDY